MLNCLLTVQPDAPALPILILLNWS